MCCDVGDDADAPWRTRQTSRADIAKSSNQLQTALALARSSGEASDASIPPYIWMRFAFALALLPGNGMATSARAAA